MKTNKITHYSLSIFQDFYEDLDKNLFAKICIEGGLEGLQNQQLALYDLIFLNLTFVKNELGIIALQNALKSIREGGILLINLAGSDSYHELIQSLAFADLEDNFFLVRVESLMNPEGILTLAREVGIKSPALMENRVTFLYDDFTNLLQDLQEAHSNFLLRNDEMEIDWKRVANLYKENFSSGNQFKLTLNLLTLFLVKR